MSTSDHLIAQPAAPIRFKRLRLGIVVLGLLVILAFAASSAYDAWRAYRNSLAATDREIGNVAKALAEQTAWSWQGIDLLLRDTARWYRNDGPKLSSERLDEVLANRTAGVHQLRLITIVDAQGIQRHRSRGSTPPNLDVSDRAYFIAQRDNPATGLFISEPLVTRSEGRAGIVLARRLDDDNGKFAGVVTAIVDLEDLERFYGSVTLGKGSAIQLLSGNGTLLVRNPPAADAIGKRFPDLAAIPAEPASRVLSPIDGRRDFIAVARVRDTPLVLAVTRDETVAMQLWRDEAARLAARTIVVALLGLAAIAALWRQLKRVETGERALRDSEERYALAMEGANEGHWDWNLETDQLFLSSKMKMLEGHGEDHVATTRAAWNAHVVIHADDKPRLDAAVKDHLEGRTPSFECEYRVEQRNGDWHWLLTRGRCLRDAAGKPYRFVGSAIDVTTQKQAQSDKERLEAQLRQSEPWPAASPTISTISSGRSWVMASSRRNTPFGAAPCGATSTT